MMPGDDGAAASRPDGVVISPDRQTPDGKISARARVAAESPWFKGHFPAEPILPGIAQVGLVFETIQSFSTRRMRLAGLRRVRFRQVVGPGDCMHIVVTPPSGVAQGYTFRIFVDNMVVCSGTLDVL